MAELPPLIRWLCGEYKVCVGALAVLLTVTSSQVSNPVCLLSVQVCFFFYIELPLLLTSNEVTKSNRLQNAIKHPF